MLRGSEEGLKERKGWDCRKRGCVVCVFSPYLLSDRVVHSLRHLVGEPHDVLVAPPTLVEVIRLPQHVTQPLGS